MTARVQGDLTQPITITLGDLKMVTVTAVVLDLSQLSRAAGRPIGVVVGRELLDSLMSDFDFPHRRVMFAGRSEGAVGRDRVEVRLSEGRVPQVLLRIGDRSPIQATFDPGSDAPAVLSPDYAEHAGVLRGLAVSTVASAGVEGVGGGQVAVLPEICIGRERLKSVPVERTIRA